jgi:hypothetical protein
LITEEELMDIRALSRQGHTYAGSVAPLSLAGERADPGLGGDVACEAALWPPASVVHLGAH